MKKSVKIILGALAVYLALLLLLVAAEAGNPDASIRTVWDAVWFSLITMTTVGYGDLSPVTPAGRILGLIFALCSIGILTALIGIGLRLIGGEFIPHMRLRLGRGRTWYVFDRENEDAAALAEELRHKDKGCLFLFPAEGEPLFEGLDTVRLNVDGGELFRLRGKRTDGCFLFFLGDDLWANYASGQRGANYGFTTYCMTDVRADDVPPELHLFSRNEAVSRCYWKERPLERDERCVVLIGCGSAGSAILERAILTNVFPAGRRIEYHVFADSAGFAATHPKAAEAMAPGTPDEDTVAFHPESWTECPELISRADRIILCADSDEENLAVYEKLHTWFVTKAKLHVRLEQEIPPLCSFGSRREVVTTEYVMKDAVNRQARIVNDLYNEKARNPKDWRELGWFHQQSNIAAADHLIVKIRLLLEDDSLTEVTEELCRQAFERYRALTDEERDRLWEMEHRRWMRFHWLYNWDQAAVRDDSLRRHPMLIPYARLAPEEQRKDAYAWELLGRLADR